MRLSTIAMIALIIVLILVSLILIILLTPITYSLEFNGRTPYRVELSVKWLWRVLSLRLAYFQNKPFFKELYILGQQKIGPVKDYEEWLEQRVDDEYQAAMAELDNDPMAAQAEAMMKAMSGEGTGPTAPSATMDTSASSTADTTFASEDMTSTDGTVADGSTQRTGTVEPSTNNTQRVVTGDELSAAEGDEVVTQVSFNEDGTVKGGVLTKIKTLKDSVVERFQGPDPNDPVASFKSEIPTFWFMKHVTNVELWRQLLLVGKRCTNHAKPGDIYLEGLIGLGDPYKSGMLAAAMYTIWPEATKDISIDYMRFQTEGSGHIKGRIVLGVLAWHGTRFLLSKPMRSFIGDTIRVLWIKRKEAKILAALEAEQLGTASAE